MIPQTCAAQVFRGNPKRPALCGNKATGERPMLTAMNTVSFLLMYQPACGVHMRAAYPPYTFREVAA